MALATSSAGGTMSGAMTRRGRKPKPAWLQILAACIGLVLFTAAYLVAMWLTVDVSLVEKGHTPEHRDTIYLELHAGVLLIATIAGFGLGKWLNGLGVAYAVLFFTVIASAMVFASLGSYTLACEGHNDLIRHWTC